MLVISKLCRCRWMGWISLVAFRMCSRLRLPWAKRNIGAILSIEKAMPLIVNSSKPSRAPIWAPKVISMTSSGGDAAASGLPNNL